MTKGKIIVILVVVLLVGLFVGRFVLKVSKDFKQEGLIKDEFNSIMELNKNKDANKEEIDKILNRKVTSGSYAKVEAASKEYLKDLYRFIDNINFLVSSENVNYLSIDNIKEDMDDDFKVSKESISDTKDQISDNISRLIEVLTNETIIMGYLDTKDLSDYYINFYKELVLNNGIDADYINNKYGYLIERLNIYEKAINFLVENKKFWHISETIADEPTIMFDNDDLTKQYQEITGLLKTVSNSIKEE